MHIMENIYKNRKTALYIIHMIRLNNLGKETKNTTVLQQSQGAHILLSHTQTYIG